MSAQEQDSNESPENEVTDPVVEDAAPEEEAQLESPEKNADSIMRKIRAPNKAPMGMSSKKGIASSFVKNSLSGVVC